MQPLVKWLEYMDSGPGTAGTVHDFVFECRPVLRVKCDPCRRGVACLQPEQPALPSSNANKPLLH
jgi:hypothetical protein